MFWKNKQFKEQKEYWYSKLEESGFRDIELDEFNLKNYAEETCRSSNEKALTSLQIDLKREYYLRLEHKFRENSHSFPEGKIDYFVMYEIMRGLNINEIVRSLKEKFNICKSRTSIRYIKRQYENAWGIREWTPEQMDYKKKA